MHRLNVNLANRLRDFRLRTYAFNYKHVLGTSLELQIRARSETLAKWAHTEVLTEIDRLDHVLSDGSATNELAEVQRDAELWRALTGAQISLDSIARGYIVGLAAARGARAEGVDDVLLSIGGDVQHYGAHPTVVGVADPLAPGENSAPIGSVRIQNAALATIASASVFAADCAIANALATAFSVLQPRESVALADALPGVGCMLVGKDGAITTSSAWMDRAVYAHQLRVA